MATCRHETSSDTQGCPLSCREDTVFCQAGAHDDNVRAREEAQRLQWQMVATPAGEGVESWPVGDYYGELQGMKSYSYSPEGAFARWPQRYETFAGDAMLEEAPLWLDDGGEFKMNRNLRVLREFYQRYLKATGWNPSRSHPRCPSRCPNAAAMAFNVAVSGFDKWSPILQRHQAKGFYIKVKVCLLCFARRRPRGRGATTPGDLGGGGGAETGHDPYSHVTVYINHGECPGEGYIWIFVTLCGEHGTGAEAAAAHAQLKINEMFGPDNQTEPLCDPGCAVVWENADGSGTPYDGKTPPAVGKPEGEQERERGCSFTSFKIKFVCVRGDADAEGQPPDPGTPEGGGCRTRGGSAGGGCFVQTAPRLVAGFTSGDAGPSFPVFDSDLTSRVTGVGAGQARI